jgi:NAD(P)-dependent dehydrogenase (short-subunit alcohol dehydrogenase family)
MEAALFLNPESFVRRLCMCRLEGKIALVTGAGAGIGLAIARLFAAEGAHVYVSDIDAASAEAGAAAIAEAGGSARALQTDVTDAAQVDESIAAIRRERDALHVLVNNAGILLRSDFRHMDDGAWSKILDTHLWGAVRVTRAAFPLLQAAKGAAVVNLSSITAHNHARQLSAYSTAKGALSALSRALAVEFAPFRIRVNYLCPGFIPTKLTGRLTAQPIMAKGLLTRIPMRRFGEPEEVARAALFLASDDSSYVTGEGLTIDGGMSLNLL